MSNQEIVIVSGARTPMAEWIGGKRGDGLAGGALAPVSAIDLGAVAAKGALERAGLWYDALDLVTRSIERNRGAENLVARRNAMLARVGIRLRSS